MLLYNSLPHLPSTLRFRPLSGVPHCRQCHGPRIPRTSPRGNRSLWAWAEQIGKHRGGSLPYAPSMLHLGSYSIFGKNLWSIYIPSWLYIYIYVYITYYIYMLHQFGICFCFLGKHLIWGDLFIGPHPRFWGVELPLEKFALKIKDNLIVLAD